MDYFTTEKLSENSIEKLHQIIRHIHLMLLFLVPYSHKNLAWRCMCFLMHLSIFISEWSVFDATTTICVLTVTSWAQQHQDIVRIILSSASWAGQTSICTTPERLILSSHIPWPALFVANLDWLKVNSRPMPRQSTRIVTPKWSAQSVHQSPVANQIL